jgi:ribosomal protein S6
MAEETTLIDADIIDSADSDMPEEKAMRIYEVGYQIAPTTKEEDLEKIVGSIRSIIEKHQGSFVAEGAPSLIKLAYPISVREGERYVDYDRAYFGWLKFESSTEAASSLSESIRSNTAIIRSIVFRTVREDTRAQVKVPTLREVKRTDTIKSAPRRAEATVAEGPVSEEDLEKALQDITAE